MVRARNHLFGQTQPVRLTERYFKRLLGGTMKTRHVIDFCSVLLLLFLFNGCLMYETVEYRVKLNSDGKSGTLSINYTNIQSSETEPGKQNEDFEELLSKWKGDKYLLERMNDGVYIKKRDLKLSHGILVWHEDGIFSDVQKMKDGISYEDTTHISLAKDETVLSTNGVVLISKDSTVVVWPPHTRDFHVTIQQKNFQPTSHFAEKFRQLKKK
jgi:hypothetical protein